MKAIISILILIIFILCLLGLILAILQGTETFAVIDERIAEKLERRKNK